MSLRKIISIEYILAFVITVFFYGHLNFSWLYFIVFLLLPDITMVGYLINTKVGALFYNMGHSFVLPAMIMAIGLLTTTSIPLMVSSDLARAYFLRSRTWLWFKI